MAITINEKTLDIDRILKGKLGNKSRLVPRFLVNWLKAIAHEEELNEFLWSSRHATGTVWLKECISYLDIDLQLVGGENLPDDSDGRRYTFVSNHPLGGADGIILGSVIGERYNGNFAYLVNDLLMNLPGLAPLCIPINKTGKQSRDFPRMVNEGFRGDKHMLMFPAGICSRKIDGRIQDVPWSKTFVSKSIETHRDIVPIHFSGRNSERFYRIANISKSLGLKFNPAMLLLSDEMYLNRHKTFTVTIGKPIHYKTFDKSRTALQWAQYVREKVYDLA
ncbi:MAG: glycerol acyltransferase [Bacteroidaceae bacterium]|nr:glycerol acyltransferase [Bacteroidaceae bacterium]